jgi:hypothetical protein
VHVGLEVGVPDKKAGTGIVPVPVHFLNGTGIGYRVPGSNYIEIIYTYYISISVCTVYPFLLEIFLSSITACLDSSHLI